MPSSRLSLALNALLLLGAGALMLLLGDILPLLVASAGLLLAGLVGPKSGGGGAAWISTIGALAIFISGTPLTGSPPEGLLITTAMAIYFICWVQQVRVTPLSAVAPAAPFTLAFYSSLLLAFMLLRSQVFPLPYIGSIFLATTFILISLALWELGRRSRLTQAAQAQSPSLPDWLGRVLVLAAIFLVTFLLFRLPLPWMANAALNMAAEMDLTASHSEGNQRSDRNDPRNWDPENKGGNNDTSSTDRGNGEPTEAGESPWSRGQLPQEAELELSDEPRFHMEIPDEAQADRVLNQPIYLREQALSLFQNDAWMRAPHREKRITDAEDGETDGWVTMNAAPANRVIQQRIYLYNHFGGRALPVIPNVLAFKAPEVLRQGDDLFSLPQVGDVIYELASAPIHYEDVARRENLEAGEAPPHYTATAQGLTFRDIDNLLLAPIQETESPLKEKLHQLQRFFDENYTYSNRVENPKGLDPLANFLFHEKQGYCDFFAQAGAHMVRRLGVPSRVAYGYAGGMYDPAAGLYTFRQRDSHSWTEIFLKDLGWVIFDLTPKGQGANHPAQTLRSGAGHDPLMRFGQADEAADEPAQQEAPPSDSSNVPELERWFEGIWILQYLDLILGVIVLVLLATYLYRRRRQRTAESDSDGDENSGHRHREPPGYFRDFCELFDSLGCRRAAGETLREYFAELKQSRLVADEFDPLLVYHYKVEYENEERRRNQEKQFCKQIREFKKRR